MNATSSAHVPALLAPPPIESDNVREAGNVVPGSPVWHAARRSGVGGSDVAAIMNLSPWTSALEVYMQKRGELEPQEGNAAMQWGTMLEPLIRQHYANVTGLHVMVPRSTYRSETHPFMIANLDGIASERVGFLPVTGRVLECKAARTAEGWGEAGSADVPLAYLLQTMHYMKVTQLAVADVAVLIGGSDFRIYTIEADRELQGLIVEAESVFWQRVQDGAPPPVVDVEDARLRWGRLGVKGQVRASVSALEALATLRDAKQHREDLEAVEDECKAQLMGFLADMGDTLVDAKGRALATWKLAKAPEKFDVEGFALAQPTLYRQYLKAGTPSRRFLMKNIDE